MGSQRKGGVPEITADFTVFHRGLPCLPLLTSKLSQRLCVPAQTALPAATRGRAGGEPCNKVEDKFSATNLSSKTPASFQFCAIALHHQAGGFNSLPCTKTAFTGRSPGTWAASQGVSRVLGSAVCLWADGCVFCNPVGAPGFGKSWLLSPERCRASDYCWQLISSACCHSTSFLCSPC